MSAPESRSALSRGLVACSLCEAVNDLSRLQVEISEPTSALRCGRCGSVIHARYPRSLERSLAFLIAAVIAYIPANVYPIMTLRKLGEGEPATILGGIFHLAHAGMWSLAAIVFVASVLVPVLKLVGIAYLVATARRATPAQARERTRLYRMVEAVGRWSMVDVFVISILVALVQLGALATIESGPAATAFCVVVVLTMLSAMSFDPRLIWDATENGGHDE